MTRRADGRKADGSEPARAGDRIRAAARELFYSRGIRGVGVDEIVARAGVTKPSLYRGFASKDALVVACLEDYAAGLVGRLDEALAAHPGDPRAGLVAFLSGIAERSARPGFRGCGLSNAAVEYPEAGHPVREAVLDGKRVLHARLAAAAAAAGAAGIEDGAAGITSPVRLADALLLLIEGAFACGQIFGAEGPNRTLAAAAEALIAASLVRPAGCASNPPPEQPPR
ncbi:MULTISPECIES: TetR/AcrR family transcriptional regulator [Methylobacterium]|uniref:TetR/AcrR family transcriptional regulator n=1 Tax=Methylobacterium TaxID=407 RepID=UPI0013EBF32D|nr:TetR/AcrR family transcriptional regulator [Methylobacterium sp. DB0501]NGM33363.1 TetR/AcrR family transcriptional regulator [Methylobacterium sp. DB0501]